MSVKYNTDDSIIGVAFRVSNTVIPDVVFGGFEFWLLLIVNITVRILRWFDIFKPTLYNVELPWGLTGVTGSLMTFFVCFYNSSQFARYNKMYDLTQAMFEHSIEFVSMLRVHALHIGVRRKCAKFVMANVMTFFFQMTMNRVTQREWRELHRLNLITRDEIEALRRHERRLEEDAIPSFMLLQWAGELVFSVTQEPADREDMLAGVFGKLYHIRECQAEVVSLMELPMPFQYFHIMNMMLILNLTLWAYALACQDSHFAPLIFVFVQLMFQGLRSLSTSLADPFGDDEVDFPLDDWVKQMYCRLFAVVEEEYKVEHLLSSNQKEMMQPEEFSKYCDIYVDVARAKSSEALE